MAQRKLELKLISANDLEGLKGVNLFSGKEMAVYAVVSLSCDTAGTEQKTMPDCTGGCNPTWNAVIHCNVPASGAGFLDIHLRAHMHLVGERNVGEVHIPLSELLSGAPDGSVRENLVTYQVLKKGEPQGVLNFSYKLGKVTQSAGCAPNSAPDYPPPPAARAEATAGAYTPPTAKPPAGNPSKPVKAYPAARPNNATPYAAPPQPGYQQRQQQAVRPQRNNVIGNVLQNAIGGLLLETAITGGIASAINFYNGGVDDGGVDGGVDDGGVDDGGVDGGVDNGGVDDGGVDGGVDDGGVDDGGVDGGVDDGGVDGGVDDGF